MRESSTSAVTGCETPTFVSDIKASPGQKVQVVNVRTMADQRFLLAGNLTEGADSSGFIQLMSTNGDLEEQRKIKIRNKKTRIQSVHTLLSGRIVLSGIFYDVNPKAFIIVLNGDLTGYWMKEFDLPGKAEKIVTETLETDGLITAIQSEGKIYYTLLKPAGTVQWSGRLDPPELDEIVSIGGQDYSIFLIAYNCSVGGKKTIVNVSLYPESGIKRSSNIVSPASNEKMIKNATSYNNRLNTTGVEKRSATEYILFRNLSFYAETVDVHHAYKNIPSLDFSSSVAMDNAGDILGVVTPATGNLFFIRHFAGYGSLTEYTRQYNVETGSSIAGITRSFNDGGYLICVNKPNGSGIQLIKTDSIGRMGTCAYKTISNFDLTQMYTVPNDNYNVPAFTHKTVFSNTTFNLSPFILTPVFTCREKYCPPDPTQDTCLSSFYKTYRSGAVFESFNNYYLLRNGYHLMAASRADRVLGNLHQVSFTLKILDVNGKYIRGKTVYANGVSNNFTIDRIGNDKFLLSMYTWQDAKQQFTFTLIDEDLNIIWTKSVRAWEGYNFTNGGDPLGRITSDAEGNIYFTAINPGYLINRPIVLAYKFDKDGNDIWVKSYESGMGSLFSSNVVVAGKSLVIVAEGASSLSHVSLQIDKESGNLLNSWSFQSITSGAVYERLLAYDGNRIFYCGNYRDNSTLMGIFDSTGKPIKARLVKTSFPEAAVVKNGKMYAMLGVVNRPYTDCLIKMDTSLNVELFNEYEKQRNDLVASMQVNDVGEIFIAGSFLSGSLYYHEYLNSNFRKLTPDGQLGTCTFKPSSIEIADYPLDIGYPAFNTNSHSFTNIDVPVILQDDTYTQNISELLCSSKTTCDLLKIKGPQKICQLNTKTKFLAEKNSDCNLQSVWQFDTAFIHAEFIHPDSVMMSFKKNGKTWIRVNINTGCIHMADSMEITIQGVDGKLSLGPDTVMCTGDKILLQAGSGFDGYQWQDGSSDSKFLASQAGKYYVDVKNTCGTIFTDTILISESIAPLVNLGNDTTLCMKDTLRLSAAPGFSDYEWSGTGISGTGSSVFVIPFRSEAYSVLARNENGCVRKDTINVVMKQARPISLGADTGFCAGSSITLHAGSGFIFYLWNDGSTGEFTTVSNAGKYFVQAIDINGCFAKDTIQILPPFTLPVVSLGDDFDLCAGENKVLKPGNFASYAWNDGSVNHQYTVTQPGKYWVTVTDSRGCTASDTVAFRSYLARPSNFLKPVDSLCKYERRTLFASQQFSSYQWSTGAVSPTLAIETPGTYILAVTDNNGCEGSDTTRIVQKNCMNGVYIPTAFTPNGDGTNDQFRALVFGDVISFKLSVYNRWGELVFSTNDPSRAWDGNLKGKVSPSAVFTWQCTYQLRGSEPEYRKGTVSLIRK